MRAKSYTHKEIITECIEKYARNKRSRFIGYNTVYGSRMYGTLNNVPTKQCIETPICENLMVGMAFGMALEGYLPVVCFERHDFLLLALDALVNHIDKLPVIGKYRLPIIIRAIVGAKEPLYVGPQHCQCYSRALQDMLENTPVVSPCRTDEFRYAWTLAPKESVSGAVVIIEHREDYDYGLGEESRPEAKGHRKGYHQIRG